MYISIRIECTAPLLKCCKWVSQHHDIYRIRLYLSRCKAAGHSACFHCIGHGITAQAHSMVSAPQSHSMRSMSSQSLHHPCVSGGRDGGGTGGSFSVPRADGSAASLHSNPTQPARSQPVSLGRRSSSVMPGAAPLKFWGLACWGRVVHASCAGCCVILIRAMKCTTRWWRICSTYAPAKPCVFAFKHPTAANHGFDHGCVFIAQTGRRTLSHQLLALAPPLYHLDLHPREVRI